MKNYPVILFIVFTLVAISASGQKDNTLIRKGNQLYKNGKYSDAAPLYQKAAELNKANATAYFNQGDAFFRNKQLAEAVLSFDKTLETSNNISMRQKAYYNKGVSLSKQQKLEESIEAYKNAVRLNSADDDARANLQKALMELKKRNPPPPEKPKNNNQEKNKKDKQDKNGDPPPQSKLSKKQVEQLLKALQQQEQQVQEKMQQKRSRSSTRPDKDW